MPTSFSDQRKDKFFKNVNVDDIIDPKAYHKCIQLLPFVLAEEATVEETEYFHQHIKNWPWVAEYYETEKALRAAIRAKLANMAVPIGLAHLIKQKEEVGKSTLIQKVKRGVDAGAAFLIAEQSGLHKETIAKLLETSLKTIRRYQKEHKKLNAKESELILKLADLFERGEQVFGNMTEFRHWLETPAYGLDHQVPLELLYTSEGINLVMDEVERIAHGDLA